MQKEDMMDKDMMNKDMQDQDMQDADPVTELTLEDQEMVTGGLVDLVKHYCKNCGKVTMQYIARNGYVCSACSSLNS